MSIIHNYRPIDTSLSALFFPVPLDRPLAEHYLHVSNHASVTQDVNTLAPARLETGKSQDVKYAADWTGILPTTVPA